MCHPIDEMDDPVHSACWGTVWPCHGGTFRWQCQWSLTTIHSLANHKRFARHRDSRSINNGFHSIASTEHIVVRSTTQSIHCAQGISLFYQDLSHHFALERKDNPDTFILHQNFPINNIDIPWFHLVNGDVAKLSEDCSHDVRWTMSCLRPTDCIISSVLFLWNRVKDTVHNVYCNGWMVYGRRTHNTSKQAHVNQYKDNWGSGHRQINFTGRWFSLHSGHHYNRRCPVGTANRSRQIKSIWPNGASSIRRMWAFQTEPYTIGDSLNQQSAHSGTISITALNSTADQS